jgi:hypothetical protein
LDLGLARGAIDGRIEVGRLVRVHQGVFAVGAVRDDPPARAAAAVLACGPGALLSHGSAAALWKIAQRWPYTMEVIVLTDRRPPGIRTHRCRNLAGNDRRTQLGIRTTSIARALLDITPGLNDDEVARAVSDARINAYLKLGQLRDVLDRNPRHWGTKRLRPFVDRPNGPTRSRFERRFLELTRTYGLPEPVLNTKVNGYEVDALFPAQRLIVELDGWDFHSDRASFKSDRERDAHQLAAGYRTLRITWERLCDELHKEAERLRRILAISGE